MDSIFLFSVFDRRYNRIDIEFNERYRIFHIIGSNDILNLIINFDSKFFVEESYLF
jgi:hypothetical protein